MKTDEEIIEEVLKKFTFKDENSLSREYFQMTKYNYECKNGHKWKDKELPRGTFLFGEKGQTRCPVCKTAVCKCEAEDGKMGAVHANFR